MPTRINTLNALAAASPKAHKMTRPNPLTQTLRAAPVREWVGVEESAGAGPLALNGEPSRCALQWAPVGRSHGLMHIPAGMARIIESAGSVARHFARAARNAFDAAHQGGPGDARKAQLRDVSSAVPGVGESQREADFGGSFALGHKGFAARIQVTY